MSEDEMSEEKKACPTCGGPVPPCENLCSWDCHIEEARRIGGRKILPNGLPIRCIKANGDMLECEHGDHPDYKFPVDVEYVGRIDDGLRRDYEACTSDVMAANDDDDAAVRRMQRQVHAFIYTDGFVAVTICEHCYAAWFLPTGEPIGHLWEKSPQRGLWRLSEASLVKMRAYAETLPKEA